MHKEITTLDELNSAIASGDVLVDFWATWCGPCQIMGEKIATELEPAFPNLAILKVNVDEASALAAAFGIQSIPSLFCYRGGKMVKSFIGVTPISELREIYS